MCDVIICVLVLLHFVFELLFGRLSVECVRVEIEVKFEFSLSPDCGRIWLIVK